MSDILKSIPIDSILVNPDQPRSVFNTKSLIELASSIRENGMLYPITVEGPHKPTEEIPHEFYILIDGERRWRAFKSLEHKTIRALVRDPSTITRDKRALLALIANLQRDNLNPIEEAKAFHRLKTDLGMNVSQITRKTGFSYPMIKSRLRLLELEEDIQDLIANDRLPKDNRLIDAVITVKDSEKRVKLATALADRGATIKAGIEACERLNQHIRAAEIPEDKTPSLRIAAIKAGNISLPKYDVFVAAGTVPRWELVKDTSKSVCDNCSMRSLASEVICKECPLVEYLIQLTKTVNN